MAIETFKRYEKKFLLDREKFECISKCLEDYMEPDKFNIDGNCYTISNIYYDTESDELIRRSITKPVYKEKLRLRSYGKPTLEDIVFLEIKKKFKGVVNKRRTKLTLAEAYDFIDNGIIPEEQPYINRQVLHELQYFFEIYDLKPAVYLSYDRWAYFSKEDTDFRITFDTNIRTRRTDLRLESGSYGDLLLPEDTWLMEVKILNAIPLWFVKILSECEVYANSFSKYGTEYNKKIEKIRLKEII